MQVVICVTTEHLGVLKRTRTCPCVPGRIGIWKGWFLRRGGNRSLTRRKHFAEQGGEPATNSTHIWHRRRPHCWEASVSTTAPPFVLFFKGLFAFTLIFIRGRLPFHRHPFAFFFRLPSLSSSVTQRDFH